MFIYIYFRCLCIYSVLCLSSFILILLSGVLPEDVSVLYIRLYLWLSLYVLLMILLLLVLFLIDMFKMDFVYGFTYIHIVLLLIYIVVYSILFFKFRRLCRGLGLCFWNLLSFLCGAVGGRRCDIDWRIAFASIRCAGRCVSRFEVKPSGSSFSSLK